MRKGCLSHRRTAKAQANLRIRAGSPAHSLFRSHIIGNWRKDEVTPLALLNSCARALKDFIPHNAKVPFLESRLNYD